MSLMEAVPSAALTAARAGLQGKTWASVVPATVVATAQIAAGTISQTVSQLNVFNTSAGWGDVRPGMTIWIGTTAGAADVTRLRVRATPTASVLYVAETTSGDPGLLATDAPIALAAAQYITIIDDYNLWSVFPRITYMNGVGTFYKDFGLTYSNQNTAAGVAGIVNLGPHRAGWVDASTDVLTESFTATVSTFAGVTVSSYAWTLPSGTTVISGDTDEQSLTVEFDPGHYLVRCEVTLSNGVVIEGVRHVFAHQAGVYDPVEVIVDSDTLDATGCRVGLRPADPDDITEFQSGALVIVWRQWSDANVTSASAQRVGFVTDEQTSATYQGREGSVTLSSASYHLKELVAFSQQLTAADSPANWQEAVPALMTFDYFVFYLLYYHTTALRIFDLLLPGLSAYLRNAWVTDPGDFQTQLQNAGRVVVCEMGQAGDGSLVAHQQQALMTTTERASLVTRVTLTEEDVAEITGDMVSRPAVGRVTASGFTATTGIATPLLAAAPGKVGGQGAIVESLEGIVVLNQVELSARAANAYAYHVRRMREIRVTLVGEYPFFEAVAGYILHLTVSADHWPDGFDGDVILKRVTQASGEARQTQLVLEPLTSGAAIQAETVPVLIGNDIDSDALPNLTVDDNGLLVVSPNIFDGWGIDIPQTNVGWPALPGGYDPVFDDYGTPGEEPTLPDLAGDEVGICWTFSNVYRAPDFDDVSPTWTSIYTATSGEYIRHCETVGAKLWVVTNQQLLYTNNAFAATISFTTMYTGETINDFGALRVASDQQTVYWLRTRQLVEYDFRVATHGFSGIITAWTNGQGWVESNNFISFNGISRDRDVSSEYFGHLLLPGTTVDVSLPAQPSSVKVGRGSGSAVDATGLSYPFDDTFAPDEFAWGSGFNLERLAEDIAFSVDAVSDTTITTLRELQADTAAAVLLKSTTNGSSPTSSTVQETSGIYRFERWETAGDSEANVTNAIYHSMGMDVDDFGLNCVAVLTADVLSYSGDGGATWGRGALGTYRDVDGSGYVRIPYRILTGDGLTLNNDKSALHVVYGGVASLATRRAVIDFTTTPPTFVSDNSLTSTIFISAHAFTVSGANGTTWIGVQKSGSNYNLIKDTSAITQTTLQTFTDPVHWLRWDVASDQKFWVAGENGTLIYTTDQGSTLTSHRGNLDGSTDFRGALTVNKA